MAVLGPVSYLLVLSTASRTEFGGVNWNFSFQAYREIFDPIYLKVLGRTLLLSLSATAITLALAYPFALFLSRLDRSQAAYWLILLLVPFWTNFLVRTLAFMDVIRLSSFGIALEFSLVSVLLTMVYNYLPFAVLPIYNSLEKIPDSIFEAAQDLGANSLTTFTQVIWPLSKSGVMIAAVLVFVPTLGEFLIPEIVGGGRSFFLGSLLQQQFLVARNWPLGAALLVLLVLGACFLLALVGKQLKEQD
jgi:spermidine/putrescine transport system permease protein